MAYGTSSVRQTGGFVSSNVTCTRTSSGGRGVRGERRRLDVGVLGFDLLMSFLFYGSLYSPYVAIGLTTQCVCVRPPGSIS